MDNTSNEKSFIERRQLFKNIWDTAMNIDDKDDIMSKPKVIKTLRLDEVDKCTAGKKKKQRINNLRHVCNRILDFCDKQDADDVFYEQMAADGQEGEALQKTQNKPPKKMRVRKVRRKVKKVKSMFAPLRNTAQAKTTVSEHKEENPKVARANTSRKTSPTQVKRVANKNSSTAKITKSTSPKKISAMGNNSIGDTNYGRGATRCRRIVRKRHKKKFTDFNVISTTAGKLDSWNMDKWNYLRLRLKHIVRVPAV